MIDESTDIANIEQVVLVFRWVDNALDAHEEFVGLYQTDSLEAKALVTIIKDTILRFNLKLEYLVMPATNACSERSFSALRRLKSHLRATMSQQRLNNLLVLHVHKNETDLLKLAEVGNEFVSIREQRFRMFGRFE